MAQLDKPILPVTLYRYRPLSGETLEREIAALCEPYLWMSKYRALNDPMEGFYTPPKVAELNAALYRNLYSEKTAIGVCCFSDTNDNELMWTHYASSYSGICVGYSTKALLRALPSDMHLARLAYGSAPPPLDIRDFRDKRRTAMRILSHKKSSWAYEREWRLIGRPDKTPILGDGCVTSIFFGSRIAKTHKDMLLQRLAGIRKFQLTVDGYEHSFKEIS